MLGDAENCAGQNDENKFIEHVLKTERNRQRSPILEAQEDKIL